MPQGLIKHAAGIGQTCGRYWVNLPQVFGKPAAGIE
jgi:hypothetical protein